MQGDIYMNFTELAKERYSLRSFDSRKVEKEKLDLILKAGQLAPTAANHQPQRILVIKSDEALAKLKDCTIYHFNAPIALLVCADKNEAWKRSYDEKIHTDIDGSIVATHMMLQAAELGLGTTWVGHFNPDAARNAFNIPENLEPICIFPLGYPSSEAKPNPAHLALAELENYGLITMVVTQNIDGLHTRAGTQNVLEVHGTLSTLTCINCFKQVASDGFIQNYVEKLIIPRCPDCGGILKPDIILYEEQLPYKTWYKAEAVSRECDLMIVAGTSLEVMPAAKLPMLAMDNGASLININNTATYIDERAEITINADVAQVLPLIAHEVLND
jgi:NAD-dependent SIR2 family protein deacetylase